MPDRDEKLDQMFAAHDRLVADRRRAEEEKGAEEERRRAAFENIRDTMIVPRLNEFRDNLIGRGLKAEVRLFPEDEKPASRRYVANATLLASAPGGSQLQQVIMFQWQNGTEMVEAQRPYTGTSPSTRYAFADFSGDVIEREILDALDGFIAR
jgi:hypothetical protein